MTERCDWHCFIHDLTSFVDEEMEEEENWLAIGEDVATPNTLVLLNLVFQQVSEGSAQLTDLHKLL